MNKPPSIERSCGSCSECCGGWLSARVYDKELHVGRPCHYLGQKGCSIYKDRPENPCKIYMCEWLKDDGTIYPEWLKPDVSKVIISKRQWAEGKEHINVTECGQTIDAKVLNWLYVFGGQVGIPMEIQVGGTWNKMGPPEFVAANTLL